MPVYKRSRIVRNYVNQDPEVLLAYEARRKTLLDELAALRRAEKQGEKKGVIKVALSMIQKKWITKP